MSRKNYHYHKSSYNKVTNRTYYNCVNLKKKDCKAKIHFDELIKQVVKSAGSHSCGFSNQRKFLPSLFLKLRRKLYFTKMIHRKKKEINLQADPKIWADLSEIPDQLSKRGETIIRFVFDTPVELLKESEDWGWNFCSGCLKSLWPGLHHLRLEKQHLCPLCLLPAAKPEEVHLHQDV